MEEEFAIIDDNGVIHNGNEYEITKAWNYMTKDLNELKEIYPDIRKDVLKANVNFWNTEWKGDLLLIKIYDRYK